MPGRRLVLAASAAWITLPLAARVAQAQPRGAPLRFGADRSLVASGLARALQLAFAADTGIDVKLVAQPSLSLLDAARDGEVDVALANAPAAEEALARQTLVHDRRLIATGEFVLVGAREPSPARGRRPVPAAPAAPAVDPLLVLNRLYQVGQSADAAASQVASAGAPAPVLAPRPFLTPGDGSGAHFVEHALWRSAQLEPRPPWYRIADPARGSVVAQARALGATTLLDRGEWLAGGGAPLDVLAVVGVETVHAMRSFRASHPAGRMFITWISGRQGRAVVGRQRGYRAG